MFLTLFFSFITLLLLGTAIHVVNMFLLIRKDEISFDTSKFEVLRFLVALGMVWVGVVGAVVMVVLRVFGYVKNSFYLWVKIEYNNIKYYWVGKKMKTLKDYAREHGIKISCSLESL